jgi:hypothetical protein
MLNPFSPHTVHENGITDKYSSVCMARRGRVTNGTRASPGKFISRENHQLIQSIFFSSLASKHYHFLVDNCGCVLVAGFNQFYLGGAKGEGERRRG